MSNVAKVAIAATAVVIVAVASFALSSPSSSPAATMQPGSSATATSIGRAGQLRGRQTVTENGVPFSFNVTGLGWGRYSSVPTRKSPGGPISLNKSIVGPQGAEAIIYWTSFPNGEYADPCGRLLSSSIGTSAAKLAAAVSRAPGTKLVKGPSDVTLGGHPAKHVALTVRKNVGCDPGFFYTWIDTDGGALWPTTNAGDTIRVWIVAVDGPHIFIQAATTVEADARLKNEVKRIVESIRFE